MDQGAVLSVIFIEEQKEDLSKSNKDYYFFDKHSHIPAHSPLVYYLQIYNHWFYFLILTKH